MVSINRSRRVTIKNTSGSVLTVKGKQLQINEEYTLATDEIDRFADDENFIGLVTSGTLQVLDTTTGEPFSTTASGNVDFVVSRDGVKTITVETSTTDPDVTITGANVTLSGLGGIALNTIEAAAVVTVSGEPLPTTSGQAIDENFLTINRVRIGFGKNGNIDGAYMRVEGVASNNTGHVMIRPAQLTGIAGYYDGGAAKKDFKIRKNGDNTNLASFTMQRQVAFVDESFPVPLDFDSGDRVQVFVAASGNVIQDPNVWMEIGWRAV